MDWFKPTSETVSFAAEICLCLTILLYLFSLRSKSRDTYLYVGFISTVLLFYIVDFFVNSNVFSSPFAVQAQWAMELSLNALALYGLWFAYQFAGNPFPKECRWVLLVMCLVAGASLYRWFMAWTPDTAVSLPHFIENQLHYIVLSVFAITVFLRKGQHARKQGYNNNAVTPTSRPFTKENRSLFQELQHPSNQRAKAFRWFAAYYGLDFIIGILYLLLALGIVSPIVWRYSFHVMILTGLTLTAFIFMDYTKERTSFQAKLVGVVLCVVLMVLGLLPYGLFGDGLATPTDPHPEDKLKGFLILIPAVTLTLVIVLPLVFHYHILRPLGEVVKGVQLVNKGDLTVKLDVDVNDEVGTLSSHFNQMTESLRAYATKMENIVHERTAALQATLEKLRRTQAQLIQQEKMAALGELTAGIAHEIQNPLNFVNNFSETNVELIEEAVTEFKTGNYEEGLSLLNDLKENEQKIKQHGKRADSIVKSMLEHSRTSKGEKQLTEINALVDEYLRLAYHGFRAKDKNFNATIQTSFDESITKINIVPQEIGRVLLNLFNNAFYAVAEKKKQISEGYEPKIQVSSRRVNSNLEITVSDNGIGISKSVEEKIFQPFFTTKPTGQGTGLGLSLSYDIVKALGGEFKVESKEGEGTMFTVILPLP